MNNINTNIVHSLFYIKLTNIKLYEIQLQVKFSVQIAVCVAAQVERPIQVSMLRVKSPTVKHILCVRPLRR